MNYVAAKVKLENVHLYVKRQGNLVRVEAPREEDRLVKSSPVKRDWFGASALVFCFVFGLALWLV
jgi:hypothetical protein